MADSTGRSICRSSHCLVSSPNCTCRQGPTYEYWSCQDPFGRYRSLGFYPVWDGGVQGTLRNRRYSHSHLELCVGSVLISRPSKFFGVDPGQLLVLHPVSFLPLPIPVASTGETCRSSMPRKLQGCWLRGRSHMERTLRLFYTPGSASTLTGMGTRHNQDEDPKGVHSFEQHPYPENKLSPS